MLRFINMRAFIVSLGVGLLFAYLSSPTHNVVFVYPTPENSNTIQYKDKAGSCYTLLPELTDCPSDESLVKNIPMQK